jgi:hypothetical protein
MVELVKDGEAFELICSHHPPAIYLDHWALRLFAAERQQLGNNLLCELDRHGTLLVSVMNIREIAGNTGQSAAELRDFLDAIGPRWFPISISPNEVAEQEERFTPRENSPALGVAIVQDDHFRRLLASGNLSLSSVVDPTRGEAGATLIDEGDPREAFVVAQVGRWRSEYASRRSVLDESWPALRPDGERLTKAIYHAVVGLCITESFEFSRRDVRDLLHAVVPSAYADFILLDPNWAAQLEKVKRRLGIDRPRIYTKRTVDSFLADLGSWG